MTKRIKRTRDYEIVLQVNNDQFMATPRESQRNWLLNRAVKEFADELDHLNALSSTFVAGSDANHTIEDRQQRDLSDGEIMEDWQIPIMQAMAEFVTASHGDVLEIGFGRGIASDFIQSGVVRSHTIVECNDSVVRRYQQWRSKIPEKDIRLVHGMWQDVIGGLGQFDGIFFHTYPLNETEFVEQVVQSSTFAEHFFPTASAHLKPGGAFTYLTNEHDSLGRAHQRSLMRHFSSFTMSLVKHLDVPVDTQDAMWADSMVIVRAVK
jgi:guanidinoacetate N-methyltransferase